MESPPRVDFRATAKYADTIIIVEDTTIYTSSYNLDMISAKMSGILENMKKCDGHFVITLPDGISAAAVEALLAYILPGSKAFDAPLLARAAKYFEMKWLSDLCEKELIFLFESAVSSDRKLDLLLMGQDLDMMELLDLAVKFFADNMKFQALKKFQEHTRFNEISKDILLMILEMYAAQHDAKPDTPVQSSNVKLIAEDREVEIDRGILSAASPVFAAMFASNMIEGKSSVAKLPEKSYESVEFMVKFLDSHASSGIGKAPAIPDELLFEATALAEEYQISFLKESCENKALSKLNKKVDPKKLVEYLDLALKFNCDKLKSSAVELSAEKLSLDKIQELNEVNPAAAGMIAMKKVQDLDQSVKKMKKENDDCQKKISHSEKTISVQRKVISDFEKIQSTQKSSIFSLCQSICKLIDGSSMSKKFTKIKDWNEIHLWHAEMIKYYNENCVASAFSAAAQKFDQRMKSVVYEL